MSYFKDENRNPLDYYGLRQPAIKQQLMPSYQNLTKPTRDTSVNHRSHSLNKQALSIPTNSRLILQKKVFQLEKQLQEYDFQRQANIVYNRQFREIGRLLGDENMEFEEIKSKIEDMILEGPVHIGNTKSNFSQSNVNLNQKSVNLLREQISQLKYELVNQKSLSIGFREKVQRQQRNEQLLKRQNADLQYKLQTLRREIDTLKNSHTRIHSEFNYRSHPEHQIHNYNDYQNQISSANYTLEEKNSKEGNNFLNRSRQSITYNGTEVSSVNWMSKLRQKDQEIEHQRQQLNDKKHIIQERNQQIRQLLIRLDRNEYCTAEKDIQESQTEFKYKQIQNKYNYYVVEYQKLSQSLADYEYKIRLNQQAIEKYQLIEGQYEQLDKNYNYMQSQLQLSKHQLQKSKHCQQQNLTIKTQISNFQTQIQDHQLTINRYQVQVHDYEGRIRDYEGKLSEYQGRIRDSQGKFRNQQTKIANLQIQLRQVKSKLSINQSTIESQRQKISLYEFKTTQLQQKKHYHESKAIEQTNKVRVQYQDIIKNLQYQLENRISQLVTQKQKTKEQQNQIIKLGQYIERLNQDIAKHQNNCTQWENKYKHLQHNQSLNTEKQGQVSRLNLAIRQNELTITQYQKQLFDSKSQISQLQSQTSQLQSQISFLESQKRELKQQKNKLQSQLATIQSQFNQLNQQNVNRNRQVSVNSNSMNSTELVMLQQQLNTKNTQYEVLQENYNKINGEFYQLQSQIHLLQSQIHQLQCQNHALQAELSQKNNQLSFSQTKYASLINQYNSLSRAYEQKSTEVLQLTKKCQFTINNNLNNLSSMNTQHYIHQLIPNQRLPYSNQSLNSQQQLTSNQQVNFNQQINSNQNLESNIINQQQQSRVSMERIQNVISNVNLNQSNIQYNNEESIKRTGEFTVNNTLQNTSQSNHFRYEQYKYDLSYPLNHIDQVSSNIQVNTSKLNYNTKEAFHRNYQQQNEQQHTHKEIFHQNNSKEILQQNNSHQSFQQNNSKESFQQNNSKEILQQNNSHQIFQQNNSKESFQQNNSKGNFTAERSEVEFIMINYNNPNYKKDVIDENQKEENLSNLMISLNPFQNNHVITNNNTKISQTRTIINNRDSKQISQVNFNSNSNKNSNQQVIREQQYHESSSEKEHIQQLVARISVLQIQLATVRHSSQSKSCEISVLHKKIQELEIQLTEMNKKIDFYQQSSSRQQPKQYSANFGNSTHQIIANQCNNNQSVQYHHNVQSNFECNNHSQNLNTNNIIQTQAISQLTKKSCIQDQQHKKSVQGELSGSSFKYYDKKSQENVNDLIQDQNSIYDKTHSIDTKIITNTHQVIDSSNNQAINNINHRQSSNQLANNPIDLRQASVHNVERESTVNNNRKSQKFINNENSQISEQNSLSKLVMGNTVNMIKSNHNITTHNKLKQSQSKIQVRSAEIDQTNKRQSTKSIHQQSKSPLHSQQSKSPHQSQKSIYDSQHNIGESRHKSIHEKINDISVDDNDSNHDESEPNKNQRRPIIDENLSNKERESNRSQIEQKMSKGSSSYVNNKGQTHSNSNTYQLPQYSKKNNNLAQITSNKLIAHKVTEIATHIKNSTQQKVQQLRENQTIGQEQVQNKQIKRKDESSKRSSVLSLNAVSEHHLQIQANNNKLIQAPINDLNSNINKNQQTHQPNQSSNQLSNQSPSQATVQTNSPINQLGQSTHHMQVRPLSVIVSNSQIQSGVGSRMNSGVRDKREESSSIGRKASPSPGRISITYGRQSKIIYSSNIKPRESSISIPEQDNAYKQERQNSIINAIRQQIVISHQSSSKVSPLRQSIISPHQQSIIVNQNNIYNGGNAVSSTNIDRRETLPLVSSKNIIQSRKVHNKIITVNQGNNSQINTNVMGNYNTVNERASHITSHNMTTHNQVTAIRQGQSPSQSNVIRKQSLIPNQTQQIVFNNNVKSSRVFDNNQLISQKSRLLFQASNNNSTLRPSSRSISKQGQIPSRFVSPKTRLSRQQIQLQTLVNDEYSPVNPNLKQTVSHQNAYHPYYDNSQTVPKNQHYAQNNSQQQKVYQNNQKTLPYQNYNGSLNKAQNLSLRQSQLKKSVFTGNLKGSSLSVNQNGNSQVCCALSPPHYQHQNKKSSLSNSQISKFNVVKQSRVSNQPSLISHNPSEMKNTPNQLNNSPGISSLKNQYDRGQGITKYRSSFGERIETRVDKMSQLSESVIGKNSQNNDINNVSITNSEDSGIIVVQKEENVFDCCKG